jgi:hypothetical protein
MRLHLIIAALALTASPALVAADKDCSCDDHDGKFRAKMLEKFDADHDGKLDDGEKAAAHEAFEQHQAEREAKLKSEHPELFAKIDKNGDGSISAEERRAFQRKHDRDCDGDHGDQGKHIGEKRPGHTENGKHVGEKRRGR